MDVSIVTQLITPVLQQRNEDGTGVFDMFGGVAKERAGNPDEVIMFCVDCSKSMGRSCDFEDMNQEENIISSDGGDDKQELEALASTDIDDTYQSLTLDQMKGEFTIQKYWGFILIFHLSRNDIGS